MNKTAIKNFAIWARNKLMAEITYKAGLTGITEKEIKNPLPQSTQTVKFFDIGTKAPYSITGIEIEQRTKLAKEIEAKASQSDYKTAYQSLVEEVAYTWFNRLIAVRFMEVNDYLPTRIRVLSSESSNKSEPDLVTNPTDADLDYTPYEKDRIMQLKNDNQLDELFRMLFIKQCNALNAILPALFEKTNDFTELLMNVSFTDQDGVVYHLIHDISEDDFNVSKEGQVEIIGWMYQYYNTEPKDETFALLKKNVKITKERIPSATQLFTPDWIVRYMVENSLGRLWLEGHPNDALKSEWKYYLDEAKQEADVQAQLDVIREEYKTIKPEDIKVIDPCMGSGHILVYAFDVLIQIYESYGYSQRDAAKSIVEYNLYGLDIDKRAYQLSYFAVMMKARQYNRRILNSDTTCHVYAIQESNEINRAQLKYFGHSLNEVERNKSLNQMEYLLDTMWDATEYGSILNIDNLDWDLLCRFVDHADYNGQIIMDKIGLDETQKQLRQLVDVAAVMAQKYDVVVTNPPYMGSGNMNATLSKYAKDYFPNSKADMFAVFIEKSSNMTKTNGYVAMITQQAFMFLSSFEELRNVLISSMTFSSMYHLGFGTFGADFGTTAFIFLKKKILSFQGRYLKLSDARNADDKKEMALRFTKELSSCSFASSNDFMHLPNTIFAYWLSKAFKIVYSSDAIIRDIATIKAGMKTGDNKRFLRLWFEVSRVKMKTDCLVYDDIISSHKKWFPYNKGGESRMWYGNHEYVINMENGGTEIISQGREGDYRLRDNNNYFIKSLSWSFVTAGRFSIRYYPEGFLCDVAGSSIYPDWKDIGYLLALLTSKVTFELLKIQNPTLNFQVENIARIPLIIEEGERAQIDKLVEENIAISKVDWDNFETSWNFIRHPFMLHKVDNSIVSTWKKWSDYTELQFTQLQINEKELNRVIIDIYGLQNQLTSDAEDKDVTIRKADFSRDVRSFISYAVGCMLGRYSLDVDGLVHAGGEWNDSKYSTFIPDKDNILPITDEEYFEDDAVGLFYTFLKKTFGAETLEENLDFIAKALGNKGNSSREIIRNYFLKDFFKDHCKIYKKRPIYWLFDSGKADGFKALVYIHRYNEDTIGNLRIDYLHRMQRVYESEISRMQEIIENSKDAREMTAATKRKEKLVKQLKETKEYDEKIAHLALARIAINLDDGVNVNYEKIQTGTDGKKLEVLAKI